MKPQKPESKNERDIRRIMIAGTAIGFGCMAASLEALHPNPNGYVSFQFSARTVLAFILGAAAVVPFWKVVFGLVSGRRTRSSLIWVVLLLLVIGAAAFLYPLRFVPAEKLPELYTGLIFAVCALSIVAALLITIGRFLNKDSQREEASAAPHRENSGSKGMTSAMRLESRLNPQAGKPAPRSAKKVWSLRFRIVIFRGLRHVFVVSR